MIRMDKKEPAQLLLVVYPVAGVMHNCHVTSTAGMHKGAVWVYRPHELRRTSTGVFAEPDAATSSLRQDCVVVQREFGGSKRRMFVRHLMSQVDGLA